MPKERTERKEIKLKWGGSIMGIVTLIFVLSKVSQIGICKDWNWIWIFSPMWLPASIFLVVTIGIFMTIGLVWLILYGLDILLDSKRSCKINGTCKDENNIPESIFPFKRF